MCVNKLETMSYKNEIRRSNAAALMGASSCVDVALGFSDFPNIHRIGLPANPRLKSNSSNKSFRAFTCDRGGRLQKSGKVGLDDRPPQMDKRVRKEAPHSEVKKCLSHAASDTSCLWPVGERRIRLGEDRNEKHGHHWLHQGVAPVHHQIAVPCREPFAGNQWWYSLYERSAPVRLG